MRTLHWLAIVGLVASAGLVACGSDDSGTTATGGAGGATGGSGGATGGSAGSATGGSAGSATGGSAGSATGGSAGSATGGSAGSATGGSAGSGTDCATDADCLGCCSTQNADGYAAFAALLIPCVCGTTAAPGPCASECADSYCSDPTATPSDACITCANGTVTSSCVSVVSDCSADTTCATFLTCALTCPQ